MNEVVLLLRQLPHQTHHRLLYHLCMVVAIFAEVEDDGGAELEDDVEFGVDRLVHFLQHLRGQDFAVRFPALGDKGQCAQSLLDYAVAVIVVPLLFLLARVVDIAKELLAKCLVPQKQILPVKVRVRW